MAIIGKIRERSGLLVTMVGLGLVLFILPLFSMEQSLGFRTKTQILDCLITMKLIPKHGVIIK